MHSTVNAAKLVLLPLVADPHNCMWSMVVKVFLIVKYMHHSQPTETIVLHSN